MMMQTLPDYGICVAGEKAMQGLVKQGLLKGAKT